MTSSSRVGGEDWKGDFLTRSVGVVMAIRNEEESIASVLDALDRQTLAPSRVVVVDDGSTDNTPRILRQSNAKRRFDLRVLTLPYHEGSKVAKPQLAQVLNAGLILLKDPPVPDYVMKLDGDHLLPPTYLERMIEKMQNDPSLAVASGWIVGEPYDERAPRGSSMIIRTRFWKEANAMKFYVNYGWEDWIHLKALQMGYTSRCFKEIQTRVHRTTDSSKGALYGRAMYALGYDWFYALGACMVRSRHSPKIAVRMLSGYLRPGGVSRLDISDWVGKTQRQSIPRAISRILRDRARR
jgi:biofilm PGA synthesis N-glycosyltransferase PgaC